MFLRRFITIGAVVGAAVLSLAAMAAARTDATPSPTASTNGSATASPASSGMPYPSASSLTHYPPPRTLPPGSIRVKPSTVAQGGRVQVFMTCFGYAYSTAFGKLWPSSGNDVYYATVFRDARVGQHAVVMLCANGDVGPPAMLTVVKAQTEKVPHGGVDTGGGGAADQVARQTP